MIKFLQTIKFLIKSFIAYSLYYSGALKAIKNIKLKNNAIVLTYHRVLPYDTRDNTFSHQAIIVDPVSFAKQINFIQQEFNIVSEEDFKNSLNSNIPFKNNSCLITFDDGWKDNYTYAFPILKENNVPALIFLPTDFIGTDLLFWQEAMGHGFYKLLSIDNEPSVNLLKQHKILHLKNNNSTNTISIIMDYVRELKELSYSEIDKIMEDIVSITGELNYSDIDQYLDWNNVQEMHASNISFGSHACSHKILTRLSKEDITNELKKSREIISSQLNTKIDTIAYPNGNYNSELGKLAEEEQYSIGFGTEFGHVAYSENKFNIRRININDAIARNKPIMLATILGIF